MKQRQAKELLGRQFRVVKNGLDPAEVMAFLEEVVGPSDAVLRRLEHFASLQKLSETAEAMAEEARQMSVYIKERAKREAEAEKAQVIAEAQRKAQQMIDQTNAVLLEATTKAREMEEMAFKKAKEMVDITTRVMQQNIQSIAGARVQETAPAQEPVPELTNSQVEAVEPPADARVQEIVLAQEPIPELTNSQVEAVEPPADARVQEIVLAQEPIPELTKVEESEKPLDSAPGLQTIGIGVEEERTPVNVEAHDAAPKEGNSGVYSGKVTLAIPRGAGQSWMQQLREQLCNNPGVHIGLEAGTDTGGNIMTLSLDEPIPLTSILLGMPNVERVVEGGWNGEQSSTGLASILWQRLPEEQQRTTLTVVLSEDNISNPLLEDSISNSPLNPE